MPNKEVRVVVLSNGKFRRLLGMNEHRDGSVYVRVYSGLNAGLYNYEAEIGEHRFSLHASPHLAYSVMHRHTRLKDGSEQKSASRVAAIKAGIGFSPVFFTRFTDLVHPLHDISQSKGAKADNILGGEFNYDHRNSTLFLGLFVGARDAQFESPTGSIYGEWTFEKLKVIALVGYSNFRATPFGITGHVLGSVVGPNALPEIIAPLSSKECEDLFRSNIHYMQRSQLQEMLNLCSTDEQKEPILFALNNWMPAKPINNFNMINTPAT